VPRSPATAEAVPDVPEVGRLAWMLFFEPVTLFHLLSEAGVSGPGKSLLGLLDRSHPADPVYARRMLVLITLLGPLAALALAAVSGFVVQPLPRGLVLGMLLSGLTSGAVWALASSMAFGAATAVAIPVAGVSTLALLSSSIQPATQPLLASTLIGFAPGAAAGLVFSVARALTVGQPLTWRRGLVAALVLAAVGSLLAVRNGAMHGAVVGVALVAGFLLFCFRLVLWPLEALLQAGLFAVERLTGRPTLAWTPVLWHDLSYLPLPFLAPHVMLAARDDVGTVRRVVASCFIAPGQRSIGRVLQKRLKSVLVGDVG
jgi:hypothetical protein